MSSPLSETPATPSLTRRSEFPLLAIAIMVLAFLAVIWQRDRIRAQWWLYRLPRVESLEEQAYYVACLASIRDAGAGAIGALAANNDEEVAALAIPASQGLSVGARLSVLRQLLRHGDLDVRLGAATAISFIDDPRAVSELIAASKSGNAEFASAALAGLSRVQGAAAVAAVSEALRSHENPMVRAQAAESLGQHVRALIGTARSASGAASQPIEQCKMVATLAAALADTGTFAGQLALEREVEAVSAAVTAREGMRVTTSNVAQTPPTDKSRVVGEVAAMMLSELTGHIIAVDGGHQSTDIAEQCCRWIMDRQAPPRVEMEVPTE